MQKLGTITRIDDLRKVWKNEASDFTPWLARNLDILSNTLDINLELIETESQVGGYLLDILAEDSDSEEKVIIENQLEQTDHDHLGKVITYAAGKNAKKIIWIVKKAREEHRAAVEWLNANTTSDLLFFLLEIQLWSIDGSAPAPKFEIIEQPNNWAKVVKNTTNSTGGAAVQFKYKFWNAFNDYAFTKSDDFTKSFKQHKASSDHWYTLSIGSSSRAMLLLVNTKTNIVTVEYKFYNGADLDKSQYDSVYLYKDQIEQTLGCNLIWKRLDNKKESRILLEHSCNLKDENSWNNIFDRYKE
ncbi:MAG: DUF4268 domain-containing protein, partial [Lachnospiraceae bacterium]|nr:DUF4268 domain-containing protein [Lachnospiraceae bacterium]